MEMAHSVEGRPVFLDHPLVEFATKLPVDLKIKGLTEKYILREAMKDVLTEEVYTRQKHPFLAPPAAVDLDSKLFQFYEAQFSKMKEYAPFYNSEIYGGLIQGISKMPAEQRAPLDQLLSITVSLITLGETFNVKSE